jgi:formylglycine-generating enzyme required for sulfatase activity/tRNA A-37 threonylcarbamoyl transferase component Bud32
VADLTGKDVGRYHVIERLGQGGMAEVYKAYDTRLEREVALKVIRKDVIGTAYHEAMMKRFEREAKALARLSHPNIVQVYDFGTYKGAPYLVMEYLPGGVLTLKVHGTLTFSEAAKLLRPVACALECAHQEGILHRDVKPANILLTRLGEPKLSDFGIAKMLEMENSTQLTGTNMGIGTPEYMSPEQWLGKPVPQTDVYALGVVFYELVTGRRPYTADTPMAVMQKQLTDPLPRPKQYNPDLPEMVEQVLFKALAKNPQDRYASMAEFAAVLERLMLGQVETPASPQVATTAAVVQTQQAEVGEKKPQHYSPPAPVVIPTQPTPQQGQVRGVHSRVDEPHKLDRKTPWRLAGGLAIGGIVVIGLLAMVGFLIWNNLFSQAAQARGTATAAAQAVEQTPTPRSTPKPGDTQVSNKDGMVLVWVPEGEFSMGSDIGGTGDKPAHIVYLDGYWMDRTEVTNGMYALCVVAGVCNQPGSTSSYTRTSYYGDSQYKDYPVIYVDWNQATAYCEWAGRRLPSEAQWEKAARGTDGRTYPWGNTAPDANLANYNENKGDTTAVGSYPSGASPYGIMDMAGNVWEWVADWYAETYYSSSTATNPQGPASGSNRALRGGSWYNNVTNACCSYRHRGTPGNSTTSIGFRCALSPGS